MAEDGVVADDEAAPPPAQAPARPARRSRLRRIPLRVALVVLAAFATIQLVPYGWEHPNPSVVAGAPWPDAATESLARTSCYACHSNETDWPPYSYVAPMSWLVRDDVETGRDELNFSEWDDGDADDAADVIAEGEMPLSRYTMLHPDARLSDDERRQLIDALTAMGDDD